MARASTETNRPRQPGQTGGTPMVARGLRHPRRGPDHLGQHRADPRLQPRRGRDPGPSVVGAPRHGLRRGDAGRPDGDGARRRTRPSARQLRIPYRARPPRRPAGGGQGPRHPSPRRIAGVDRSRRAPGAGRVRWQAAGHVVPRHHRAQDRGGAHQCAVGHRRLVDRRHLPPGPRRDHRVVEHRRRRVYGFSAAEMLGSHHADDRAPRTTSWSRSRCSSPPPTAPPSTTC